MHKLDKKKDKEKPKKKELFKKNNKVAKSVKDAFNRNRFSELKEYLKKK